jgi:uncharacterized protein (DUF1499 family)
MTTRRWSGAALWLGAGGLALAAAGAYGHGFGLFPLPTAGLMLIVGLGAAALALIAGLVAWFRYRRSGGMGGKAWLGMIAAIGLLGYVGSWLYAGRGAPMIHDVTTNSANPPAFATLTVRADNLAGVGTVETWRKLHDAAYGDIQPLILVKPPAEAIAIAKGLVEARGWAIAAATADRIEATETQSPFSFKDDVVIIATADETGGTRIDMRSVSRVGTGDVGVNAKRVRAFLADLKAAAGG